MDKELVSSITRNQDSIDNPDKGATVLLAVVERENEPISCMAFDETDGQFDKSDPIAAAFRLLVICSDE